MVVLRRLIGIYGGREWSSKGSCRNYRLCVTIGYPTQDLGGKLGRGSIGLQRMGNGGSGFRLSPRIMLIWGTVRDSFEYVGESKKG